MRIYEMSSEVCKIFAEIGKNALCSAGKIAHYVALKIIGKFVILRYDKILFTDYAKL
jgi:hypothetical protein